MVEKKAEDLSIFNFAQCLFKADYYKHVRTADVWVLLCVFYLLKLKI